MTSKSATDQGGPLVQGAARSPRRRFAVLAGGLATLGVAIFASAGSATVPGGNGLIVFSSNRDGNEEIYKITPTGTNPVRLTNNAVPDFDPAVSPDGTKVAFTRTVAASNNEIFTMNIDGTGLTQLTTTGAGATGDDRDPAWSPSGASIAFRSSRDGDNEIWSMTAAGGSLTNLTNTGLNDSDFNPDWSPDGTKIAFQRFNTNNEVFVMNSNGSGQNNLSNNAANDGRPSWSPDNTQIAFDSNRDGDAEIFSMTAAGGSQTQLTTNTATDQNPSWSPNGAAIAFNTNLGAGADQEIHRIPSGGGATTALTNNTATDINPSWQTDNTPPDTVIDTGPADGSTIPDDSAAFTFHSTEANSTLQCSLDGPFAPCNSGTFNTGALADGSHTFTVKAIDVAGNEDPTPASRTFTIDTIEPIASIDTFPSDPSNDPAPVFTFSSNEDPDSTFECRLDTDPFAACVSGDAFPVTDGSHTFEVRATDEVGNTGPADSYTWTVDLIDPVVDITVSPPAVSNNTNPHFEFTVDDNTATIECQIDGGSFDPCDSSTSHDLSGLGDGPHTFVVRATDPAGNAGQDSHTWDIDTAAPSATIDVAPDDPSNDTTPEFQFSSVDLDVDRFECSLDGGLFDTCSSPFEVTPALGEGPHTFDVRAVDVAGNTGPLASHSWNVDLTAPIATIDPPTPTDPSNDTDPEFFFSSNDPSATFECSLDTDPFLNCVSGDTFPVTGEGDHTFEVRAIDGPGNVGAADSFTWELDTTFPVVDITDAPDDPTASDDAHFEFTASDLNLESVECSLDLGAFVACDSFSSQDYTDLGDGSHTFVVTGNDTAGNVGADSHTWTVDTTGSEIEFTDAPDDPTNSNDPHFEFTVGDAVAVTCQLDAETPIDPCASPQDFTDVADGDHTFTVTAFDALGNESSLSHEWTIDTAAPETTIDPPTPTDPSNDTDPEFFFSSDKANSTFECRLDADPFAACVSGDSFPVTDGSRTFEVQATDALGNVDPTPASFTWTVETGAPTVTIDDQPTDPSADTTPEFEFSSPDGDVDRFECQIDAGDFELCSSPHEVTPELADGEHTFTVRVYDEAGNFGEDSFTWIVEAATPEVVITDGPDDPTNSLDAHFEFTVDDPSADVECSLDGEAFASCDSPEDRTVVGEGPHTFTVRATDDAANTGSDTHEWDVDQTAPVATIDPPTPTDPSSDTAPEFTFSSDEDPNATFECRLDTDPFAACDPGDTFPVTGDGSHTFEVQATDAAGNTGPADAFTWALDTTGADIEITAAPDDPTNSTNAHFEFTIGDAIPATVTCQLDGETPINPCTSPQDFTGLGDADHTFTVSGEDALGNDSSDTHTWTVDLDAPPVTINSAPGDPDDDQTPEFTFSSPAGDVDHFECKVDLDPAVPCTDPFTVATALSEGPHEFTVFAIDEAGNVGTDEHEWNVDTTAPVVTITAQPPASTTETSASFAFTVDDALATVECQLDGAAFAACDSNTAHAYTGLSVGPHVFIVRGTDELDRESSDTYSWLITSPAGQTPGTTPPVTNPPGTGSGTGTAQKCRKGFKLKKVKGKKKKKCVRKKKKK